MQKIGRDVSAGDRMFGTASRPVNPELPIDQAHLSPHALARIPAGELSFPEHAHHFKTFQRGVGRFHRFEAKRRLDQTFEFAVIGFDDVIQVFDVPVLYRPLLNASLVDPCDRVGRWGFYP